MVFRKVVPPLLLAAAIVAAPVSSRAGTPGLPYVDIPALAEAVAEWLPDYETFTYTGLALGATGLILYYSKPIVENWLSSIGATPPSVGTSPPADWSEFLPDTSSSQSSLTSYSIGLTADTVYDCQSKTIKTFPWSGSFPSQVVQTDVGGGLIKITEYVCQKPDSVFPNNCDEGYIIRYAPVPIDEYCGVENPEQKIQDAIESGNLPPALFVSTKTLPDADVVTVPPDAVHWEEENDTVQPVVLSPDMASQLQDTQALQDAMTSLVDAIQELKRQNANMTAVADEIAKGQAEIEKTLQNQTEAIKSLPQEMDKQIAQSVQDTPMPALPGVPVFNSTPDIPPPVNYTIPKPFKLQDRIKTSFGGACSITIATPFGGTSTLDFCRFAPQLEAIGQALEDFAKFYFVVAIFL